MEKMCKEMVPRGAQKLHYPLILSALDISASDEIDQNIDQLLKNENFIFFKSRVWPIGNDSLEISVKPMQKL